MVKVKQYNLEYIVIYDMFHFYNIGNYALYFKRLAQKQIYCAPIKILPKNTPPPPSKVVCGAFFQESAEKGGFFSFYLI